MNQELLRYFHKFHLALVYTKKRFFFSGNLETFKSWPMLQVWKTLWGRLQFKFCLVFKVFSSVFEIKIRVFRLSFRSLHDFDVCLVIASIYGCYSKVSNGTAKTNQLFGQSNIKWKSSCVVLILLTKCFENCDLQTLFKVSKKKFL